VILEGRSVRLEPLSLEYVDDLWAVGSDESLWTWSPTPVRSRDQMQAYVEAALAQLREGTGLPFVMMEPDSGRVIGSTRFYEHSPEHKHVQIGYTWIAPEFQRAAVNTEAKYLMLRHAFESWRCLRVQLRTDVLNERSRKAIGRLGAVEEGILRKHWVTATGRVRDSVYFRILDTEWPAVKDRLEQRLAPP
jgi:RimJ/RimL family protein N-acetyltransferase